MNARQTVIIPVPLHAGFAKLEIPYDLKKEEAEKIARVVIAFAVPNGDREAT